MGEVAQIRGPELLTHLKPVASGRRGSAVAIWGEPGVGKSHAARQLLGSLDCPSHCVPAVLSASRLARVLPRPARLPAWAAITLDRLAEGETVGSAGTLTALGSLLGGLAPFVLHVEDLHEAGPESSELYMGIARHVNRMPGVALLVTSRPDPGAPFASRQLLPLNENDSRRLLHSQAGATLPETAVAWVYRRAAGNPLFTLEYWRHLTREGWLYSDGQTWRWREPPPGYLPVTVEALLEQLVSTAREDADSGSLLDAAAYLPPDSPTGTCHAVSGLTARNFEAARKRLARQGILAEDRFSHPLFREVAGRFLTSAARQALARRAVSALQDQPERAVLFVEDASLDPEASRKLLTLAADASRDSLQAARLRARAARLATGPERSELAVSAARALANSDRPGAIGILTEVLDDDPEAAEAAYLLAAYHAEEGQPETALQALASQSADHDRLWTQRIGLRAAARDYAGICQLWQQKPENARPNPQTVYHISFALMVQGEYDTAEQLAGSALASDLSPLNRSQLLSVQGLCRHYRGDAEAGPLLDEALAAARASGEKLFIATCLYNRSMHLEASNLVQAMLADVEEALSIYAQVGSSRLYASTLVKLARIRHELGQFELAEESLHEARNILEVGAPTAYLVTCNAELSSLYLDWEPAYGPVLALKYAQAAEVASRGMHARKRAQALQWLSRAEGRLGRAERALELAEEVSRLLEPWPVPAEAAKESTMAAALQSVGRVDEAARLYSRAESISFENDWHVYAHKSGLLADRLRGDVEGAATRLAWFRQHGLHNGERLAMRLFPEFAPRPVAAERISPIRLELLGTPRLSVAGNTRPLLGRQRRGLLHLLLEARISGRDGLSRLALLDSLHPQEDELKAGASLKALVHQLRQAFAPELILTTPDGYALGNCLSDAEEFLQGGPTSLWRGPYPESTDQIGYVRDSLYLELAQRTAALLSSDPAEAARLAELLTESDPYSVDWLRLRILALKASAPARVPAVYRAARNTLGEVGEDLPVDTEEFLRSGFRARTAG